MINNHDDLVKKMETSALCYGHRELKNQPPMYHYYFTDGTEVDQGLVQRMVDNGHIKKGAGLVEGSDAQDLKYVGGLL